MFFESPVPVVASLWFSIITVLIKSSQLAPTMSLTLPPLFAGEYQSGVRHPFWTSATCTEPEGSAVGP